MLAGQRRGLHVVVGMSGGVDSAVTAHLMLQQGHRVTGLYATSWDSRDEDGQCPAAQDWEDVQQVCDRLGIQCARQSFVETYWTDVFEPLLAGYAAGETPNPDVLCNRRVKFDMMRQHVLDTMGGDVFATGHYAQLDRDAVSGKMRLLQSPCDKDQTLFLSQVSCGQLENVSFPVGHMTKAEVRAMARAAGLHNAEKKSSVGICFVGKRKFGDWIGEYIELTPGAFVDSVTGEEVGRHDGAEKYTLGQRARVGGESRRWFVAGKGPAGAVLLSSERVVSSSVRAVAAVWVSGEPPARAAAADGMQVQFRYRHPQQLQSGVLRVVPGDAASFWLDFDVPQAAVAPGQTIAVYDGPVCLGGATIAK